MSSTTKEKILESALKLFSRKGYLGATTKEIAKEAGIAEVTLFRYFHSKEVLFEEVINNYSFLPKLKEILKKVETQSYKEVLKIIAFEFLKLLESKKDLIRIMHSEMQRYPEKIKKIYENVIENTFKLLSNYFQKLQKEEILKEFNSELAARAFLGMFFSYFYAKEIKEFLNLQKEDVNQIIETYIDIFINGTLKIPIPKK
ncbi:MAG: DNA-binding protein [Thermodesulfobacteria bacterium]|nr:TetR/AcrR family transcriptional regulator [Thermodesulfobacteriota bacterium]MCU4138998.1 DNA-binding protein [Thermodesulfobacteriota bacterium]